MEHDRNHTTQAVVRGRGAAELDLYDYWMIVYRRRRLGVGLCAAAMSLTAVVTLLLPRTYEAKTSIVPPLDVLQAESKLAGKLGGAGESLVAQVMGVSSIADMYVGILESRTTRDAIIDRFDLTNVYKGLANRPKVRKRLERNTTITVSDEGIVRIAVRDLDPNRAATIASAYVEELDKTNKRLSTGQATSKRLFLENRLAEIEAKLGEFETILSREARIQTILYEMLAREYEIAKMEEAKSMPTIQVLDSALVPQIPRPRGVVRRVALAGIVALTCAAFFALGSDYVRERRALGPASLAITSDPRVANEGTVYSSRATEDRVADAEPARSGTLGSETYEVVRPR